MSLSQFASSLAKRRVLWVALPMLVAAGFWYLPGLLLGPKVQTVAVARKDLVQTVVASGRVATPYRVQIGSQVTGSVARIPVDEGQTVSAGQVLIELDAREARAGVQQAAAAVAQAGARIRQLRELQIPVAEQSLRQAEVSLQNAHRQYERSRDLFDKGFIGQAALDDTRKAFELADAQRHSARKQLDSARPDGSDAALAQTALQQARASLDLAQARLDNMTLRAPYAGTLIARDVERGDVVQPGKALMVLAAAGETQILVSIDEKDLGLLKPGLKALVSADAYPRQKFPAEVVYINPAVNPQTASVEIKLRAPSPPAYVTQDMTTSVDIEVARRENTLVIPVDALRDANGGEPWVMRVTQGRSERRAVKVGVRGSSTVEVLDGLSEGDLLVPANVAVVKPGMRVRASAS
jgi:HlyD family secretion protein